MSRWKRWKLKKLERTIPFSRPLPGLMIAYAIGDPIDMEQSLKTFPITLTSVKDYAARVMASVH